MAAVPAPYINLILAGGVAVALWLAYRRTSPKNLIKRVLASTVRSQVGQIVGGTVRVTGRVQGRGELLRAPVSRRSCVAYELRIEEAGEGGGELLLRRVACTFAIVDETGVALIEPEGHFSFALVEDFPGEDGMLQMRDPEVRERVVAELRAFGIDPDEGSFGSRRSLRFREGVLEDGELASVLGHAVHDPRPEGERRGPREPPSVLLLRGSSEHPLLISDDPTVHGEANVKALA
jgi:hypothetical protein